MRLRDFFHSQNVTPPEVRKAAQEATERQEREAAELARISREARTNNHFGERIAAAFSENHRRGTA